VAVRCVRRQGGGVDEGFELGGCDSSGYVAPRLRGNGTRIDPSQSCGWNVLDGGPTTTRRQKTAP